MESLCRTSRYLLAGLALVAACVPVLAAGTSPIAGEYVCVSGCLLTDAPPSVAIDGDIAHCMNEFGGTYTGTRLTDRSISCFNKTGILSTDGLSILWSNGAVWTRR